MNSKAKSVRKQAGVSLLEALLSVVVTAVAVGAAAPGFGTARATRQMEGTAAQLETDFQYARSLAASTNQNLRFSFKTDVHGTCYIVHTGSAAACSCDAKGRAVCTSGAVASRSARFDASWPVQVSSNSPSLVLESSRGTVTPTATVRVIGVNGQRLHLVVNIMGRVRTCAPSGAFRGYSAC